MFRFYERVDQEMCVLKRKGSGQRMSGAFIQSMNRSYGADEMFLPVRVAIPGAETLATPI